MLSVVVFGLGVVALVAREGVGAPQASSAYFAHRAAGAQPGAAGTVPGAGAAVGAPGTAVLRVPRTAR